MLEPEPWGVQACQACLLWVHLGHGLELLEVRREVVRFEHRRQRQVEGRLEVEARHLAHLHPVAACGSSSTVRYGANARVKLTENCASWGRERHAAAGTSNTLVTTGHFSDFLKKLDSS